MKSNYEGLTNGQAFELFNQNILLAGGVDIESQQAAHAILDEIGTMFKPYARNYAPWEIPDHVWPEVDDELQTVLIGGSLARTGWSAQRRENRPRELIYPDVTKKLDNPAVVSKAAELLIVTNKEHMRLCYVPPELLPTLVKIHVVASPELQDQILESWGATHWANQMLDREDPHPVSSVLYNQTATEDLKKHAIDLALDEVEAIGSREKLREMLLIAQRKYPANFSNEQVRRVRIVNGLPADDEAYNLHLQRVAEKEANYWARQAEIRAEGDVRGRAVLDATMSSVTKALANRWWEIKRQQSIDSSSEQ